MPVAQAAPITTAAAPAAAPAAPTSTIKLAVKAARTEPRALGGAGVTEGDPVATYKWIINKDNTGQNTARNANPGGDCSAWLDAAHTQPNTAYPDSCTWTSIAGLASSAPVAAQGDETTLNTTTGISNLAPGRYLISVLADGFKLDGTPFTIPMEAPGVVEVPLQPSPLPTATIKAQVFADITSANGQYDPGEDGLTGFQGFIADYIGQVYDRRLRQPAVHQVPVQRPEQQRGPGPGRRDRPRRRQQRADRHPPGRQVPVRRHPTWTASSTQPTTRARTPGPAPTARSTRTRSSTRAS